MTYTEFFNRATGFPPYPYQAWLAESHGQFSLLRVPTGAGKTEAAVLGWLYLRCERGDAAVPRRLVYCLPMRTLVEQTVDRVNGWLESLDMTDDVGLVKLMGGEPRTQWYLEPEKPFIVVGTQDMLLSRALNRGYGMGYNMWPVEYGLLNNDCLWVMDEVQLMANGLPTSTQLAGLRGKLETFGPAQSVWMSATARREWLYTIDHPEPPAAKVVELGHDDLADPRLSKRHYARKVVTKVHVESGNRYARNMAALIAEKHEPGTLTLAIVNTVERAQKVYRELNNAKRTSLDAEKVLVHSRFRASDREKKQSAITSDVDESGSGIVVVATQAVEAGVDISARTLITELAPWASMVQRFGRCNREGKYDQGDVLWVDVDEDAAPYKSEEVDHARGIMESPQGKSVGPAALEDMGDKMRDADHTTVIRRRDVVGLFDTTPDLSGSYLDVSQYVRGTDEKDVSVFWRDVPEGGPDAGKPKVRHDETVSVPLGSKGIDDYFKKDDKRKAWIWDFLDSEWREIRSREIHPGMTLILNANQGGYTSETGWDASSKERVEPVGGMEGEPEDGQGSELTNTNRKCWVTLSDHSRNVERKARAILDVLSGQFEPGVLEAVALAALYHDAGKVHCAFQEMLRKKLPDSKGPPGENEIMAKSPGDGRFDTNRRHFRHELGSALAVLKHAALPEGETRDLAAYLAAAHHGKVRLGIRSLPGARTGNKDSNPDPDKLLGYPVPDYETLPSVDLGEGLLVPETTLDMSIAQIGMDENGRRSWLERSLTLLERYGPFRLAYLEAIVRAADMRVSRDEQKEAAK